MNQIAEKRTATAGYAKTKRWKRTRSGTIFSLPLSQPSSLGSQRTHCSGHHARSGGEKEVFSPQLQDGAEALEHDVYRRITDQIIAAVEAGAGDWNMPWQHSGAETAIPLNAISKRPYRGVNVLALWAAAHVNAYPTGLWATYKQWQELGAQVRKGERSTLVVFWKFFTGERDDVDEETEQSTTEPRAILARGYSVFNAAQVDGFTPSDLQERPEAERIEQAERFFTSLRADIRHGGGRAFYRSGADFIQMPPFGAFRDAVAYYATLAHEVTHWSGAPTRLNRDLKGRFGDEAYAAEELVAELGAAFLCSDLRLATEPRPDHAAYVASWLKAMKNDKRAIFTASSKAQAAVDYLHSFQSE